MTGPGRFAAWVVPVALIATAALVLGGRFLIEARGNVRAGDVARTNGDEAEAVRWYGDALRMYLPASPFERRALDGLRGIAARAAAAGDRDGERRAWEAVRTGLRSTRSFYTPYPARLEEADRRLGALDTTAAFPPRDVGAIVVDRRRSYGAATVGTLVALVGFAGWVGAVVLFVVRGVDRDVRLRRAPRALVGVVLPILFLAGFALFLCGLRFG